MNSSATDEKPLDNNADDSMSDKFRDLPMEGNHTEAVLNMVPQDELKDLLIRIWRSCFCEQKYFSSTELSILAGALGGWVSSTQNQSYGDKIHDEVEYWLQNKLSFGKGLVAYFHSSTLESLSLIARTLSQTSDAKNVMYISPSLVEGYPALSNVLEELNCHCVSDINTREDGTIDVEHLKSSIENDNENGLKPAVIIANVGSGVDGAYDNINELVGVCRKHHLWLHLEGPRLSRRIIRSFNTEGPKVVMHLPDVRSLTLDLPSWLGYTGGPVLTIIRPKHKVNDTSEEDIEILNNPSWPMYAGAAYYWLLLLNLGGEEISSRLKLRLSLVSKLTDDLLEIDSIKVLHAKRPVTAPTSNGTTVYSGRQILSAIGEALEKEANKPDPPIPTVVMFRYVGCSGENISTDVVLDALNQWLSESAGKRLLNLSVGAISHKNVVWIRFAPFEIPLDGDRSMIPIEYDTLLSNLKRQVSALDATNDKRPELLLVLESSSYCNKLKFITLPNWAGLGAVRYLPTSEEDCQRSPIKWTEERIDALNVEIVKRLRSADTAFSLGQRALEQNGNEPESKTKSQPCVRFGLVTAETDVTQLCASVCEMGSVVENEMLQLDEMSSVVRSKIEEASRQLEAEQVTRVYEEGLLRKVPVVGGLLNWWSPPSPLKPIIGRHLDLPSGKLLATAENTPNLLKISDATVPDIEEKFEANTAEEKSVQQSLIKGEDEQ